MRIMLFGAEAGKLQEHIDGHPELEMAESDPDVIVCYGGDGTLLSAERRWPGIPKVPIRNSRHGHRCIQHPAPAVIERLVSGGLHKVEFIKLECFMGQPGAGEFEPPIVAMNEINIHMGHINSAVRFKLALDGQPYAEDLEIIGDGLVICTPFGSTAYYNQITRGIFHAGLGVAFKYTGEHTNHLVLPDTVEIGVDITRGPAALGLDNSPQYIDVDKGDAITIRKHPQPATILVWDKALFPSEAF